MITSLLKQLADERLLKQVLKSEHAGASRTEVKTCFRDDQKPLGL